MFAMANVSWKMGLASRTEKYEGSEDSVCQFNVTSPPVTASVRASRESAETKGRATATARIWANMAEERETEGNEDENEPAGPNTFSFNLSVEILHRPQLGPGRAT